MTIPRPEYPRPQLVRAQWMNLNGEWGFEVDHGNSGRERGLPSCESLSERITVPFAPESRLSGLGRTDFMRSVWYRREFAVPADWAGGRVILHFGAVDYMAEVWVNGVSVGTHKGGYTPFSFDVTERLDRSGRNAVTVNAYDDVLDPMQPTGKQSPKYGNYGCMYTRSTGIWQTVWLERVPEAYIKGLKLTPDLDNGRLYVHADLGGPAGGMELRAAASLGGERKATATAKASGRSATAVVELPGPEAWGPGKPVLYDLRLTLGEDAVDSYFGMRKVDINGYAIRINGEPVFQRLVLDQGYYPDGIYTAGTDDELRRDIELSMAAGFNGARLHMKVFEPRLLYWADRLGYLVWGEYPNWGLNEADERALLHMLPEWMEAVARDYDHPSVVGWCPFNETGTGRVAATFKTIYDVTRAIDPTRPIIDTSGYVHAVTDIYDVHDYEQDVGVFAERYAKVADGTCIYQNQPRHERYEGQPYFVSEFGGPWWDHDGDGEGWGYGKAPKDKEEFYARYQGWVDALLGNPRMCAFCYTQLTDVMQEKNGMYTFDRRPKFDMARVRAINGRKAAVEA